MSDFREDLANFVAGLPKAELHVHQIGSASPQTVAELAARHEGTTLVPADPEQLADYFTFTDFAHFIRVYRSVAALIRTPEDLWALTYGVARDLAAQNVRYAELMVAPYLSILQGISPASISETIEDARLRAAADFGIRLAWCVDIPGDAGLPAADITLDFALRQQPDALVSLGLGGPEIGVPRSQFAPHFARAKAAGLHSVPHAGETTGPQTVWDAVHALGAERIGHGINAVEDPDLLAYLAEHRIALEVCPTSNVCTHAVASLAEHPLARLIDAGVLVSINSDDPPMFSTNLNREYLVAAELLGLDEDGTADLARWSVRDSFLDEVGKRDLLAEIDSYVDRHAEAGRTARDPAS